MRQVNDSERLCTHPVEASQHNAHLQKLWGRDDKFRKVAPTSPSTDSVGKYRSRTSGKTLKHYKRAHFLLSNYEMI
jgi:hypothetical protein